MPALLAPLRISTLVHATAVVATVLIDQRASVKRRYARKPDKLGFEK